MTFTGGISAGSPKSFVKRKEVRNSIVPNRTPTTTF